MWLKKRAKSREQLHTGLFTLSTWLGQVSVTSVALTTASILVWSAAVATMLSVDWKSVLANFTRRTTRFFQHSQLLGLRATEEKVREGGDKTIVYRI